MNWNILVVKGKKINRDFKSNGEWNWSKLKIKNWIFLEKKIIEGENPVNF